MDCQFTSVFAGYLRDFVEGMLIPLFRYVCSKQTMHLGTSIYLNVFNCGVGNRGPQLHTSCHSSTQISKSLYVKTLFCITRWDPSPEFFRLFVTCSFHRNFTSRFMPRHFAVFIRDDHIINPDLSVLCFCIYEIYVRWFPLIRWVSTFFLLFSHRWCLWLTASFTPT